jgi:hypothetical protein
MVDLSREEIEKVQMLCSVEVDSQEKLYQLSKIDGKFRWCLKSFSQGLGGSNYLALLIHGSSLIGVAHVLELKQKTVDEVCFNRNPENEGFYKFNRLWKLQKVINTNELDLRSCSSMRGVKDILNEFQVDKLYHLLKDNLEELIPE